jgi:ABC-type glutathione transport system ATPase component
MSAAMPLDDAPIEHPVVEVADLHVTFRGRGGGTARAVDGVNLAVARGEIVALVGESGCG